MTDRALEETILLNFTIQHAGIRKLSFLLPATMADSRISVEKLRQKTVEPVSKEAGSPVRVTIELQDEEMGLLHVLVENDRLLTPGSHDVPIPMIAKRGTVPLFRTGRRYVVIENAGRDEVVVEPDNTREMEPLSNRQKEWATLRDILGREMTMAYLVATDAREPRLAFHTESHAAVATVKARIGLAETTLVVDDNGAYRGQLILRMDNATEQFLEIRLPEDARLWTARVAGDAVKPTNVPGAASPRNVRIPIIKTARGDLYYDVVLKYGGKMPAFGAIGSVEFPLIRCRNITPDLSQVRLYVPTDNQWFDFGGTMRRVGEEADLQAGYVKFQTKQTEQIVEALQRGDKWTKIRAKTSLQAQQWQMQEYQSSIVPEKSNSDLQSELFLNNSINERANQELAKEERAPAEGEAQYNRQRLNAVYQSQQTQRARNVVNDVGGNWGDTVEEKPAADSTREGLFAGEGMKQNKLRRLFRMDVATKDRNVEDTKGDASGNSSKRFAGFAGGQFKGQIGIQNGGNVQQQPSAAQVLHVVPQFSPQAGNFAANAQPQDRGYQLGTQDNFSQTTQAQRSADNSEAYQRYEQRRIQQLGLAGAYTKGMADVSYYGNGLTPGGRGVPSTPAAATPLPPAPSEAYGPRGPAKAAELPAEAETALPAQEEPTPAAKAKAVQQADAGLASLDFELPTGNPSRWTLYRFTTPRGDEQITVRNMSNNLVWRLVEILCVAAALLVLWAVIVMIRHRLFHWMTHPIIAAVLIAVGVISLCGGLMPIIGVIALVAGCAAAIQRLTSPKPSKPLAASQQA